MKEHGRGIGAVMVAFGGTATLLWLAVARLSPETAMSLVGILIVSCAISIALLGAWFLRKFKG